MAPIFIIELSKCTGCRICEMVCSLNRFGEVRPSDAHCRVMRVNAETLEPVFCRHCEDAPCIDACPVEAIQRDTATGAVLLDVDTCVGCGECMESCPYGAIFRDHEERVVKCDLCGGDPQCVRFCRSGAISFYPLQGTPAAGDDNVTSCPEGT